DRDSGDVLWRRYLFSSMVAPPISYEIDGQQYVAIMTGAGGGFEDNSADEKYGSTGRLVVFTLQGKQELPIPTERNLTIPEQPPLTASAEDVARGRILFGDLCGYCHMPSVFGRRGNVPDLRYMSAQTHAQWPAIVLGGARSEAGMASFSDVLSLEDAEIVRQYLIARAIDDRAESNTSAP
ncbi:MAG: PQQ-dependent dehydrogenase, methanol/ethanol family, partial [Pseudomonadales bacterium]|nr:PQQ-dependent dehydrogenase, methanol/ethanol family [Pseudomonadales bacterium]